MVKRKSKHLGIMENKNISNPFAQKGRIITGSTFIGRFESLKAVATNVTDQSMPKNLAIVGYPRIGKSSLAKQGIIEQKTNLIAENKIPVWIDFSKFANREAFFRYLVRYCFDELKKLSLVDDEMQRLYNEAFNQKHWDDLTYCVEKFYEYTVSMRHRFIIILDEFDEARSIFHSNSEAFKMLRELAYDGEKYGVAFVTTSRRSIKEIEVKSDCSSSTFNLIFAKEYLKMYDSQEVLAYFQLYKNIGITLSDIQKESILYYCGGHPYLLASLGFEVVETFKKGVEILDIDNIFSKIRLSFGEYYEQLLDLLKEDKTFEKMLQILFGPIINVTEDDIEELKDTYGLLTEIALPNNDKGLIAFSQHFQGYLQNVGRKIDFWHLWTGLEIAVRELITQIQKKKHQDNWLAVLKSRHQDMFNKAEKIRDEARESYKNENLLYYLDAQPIFEILIGSKSWNDFKDIFGGDKAKIEIQKKIELIVEIRNPYAHSRFSGITPTKVQQAELCCKEILDKINHYFTAQN